jgi:hypothetical protein
LPFSLLSGCSKRKDVSVKPKSARRGLVQLSGAGNWLPVRALLELKKPRAEEVSAGGQERALVGGLQCGSARLIARYSCYN